MRKDKTSSLKPPLNASCKLFHCSHTVVLYVGLPSSSQQRLQIKKKKNTAASPDVVQLTGTSDADADESWKSGLEGAAGGRLYPLSSFAACSSALSDAAEPSNLWEAMAAWWDMLFLTTSPFLHSVISCTGQGEKMAVNGMKSLHAIINHSGVLVTLVQWIQEHLATISSQQFILWRTFDFLCKYTKAFIYNKV